MATIPTPAPEAQPPMNHAGRLIGALVSPKQAFEDVARRPSWVAPIVLMAILGLVVSYALNQRMDWGSYIRQQAEKSPRFAQLSEEQKQQALETQVKYAPVFSYVIGGLGSVLSALFLAMVYWGAFSLLAGTNPGFGKSFGITSHALLPSVIATVLAVVTIFLKRSGDVDPEHLVASNAGALLSTDAPRWQMSLASSLDIFWIWVMLLLAMGFSATNPKKVSFGKAIGIVFGLWIVWVIMKVGWAAIWS